MVTTEQGKCVAGPFLYRCSSHVVSNRLNDVKPEMKRCTTPNVFEGMITLIGTAPPTIEEYHREALLDPRMWELNRVLIVVRRNLQI